MTMLRRVAFHLFLIMMQMVFFSGITFKNVSAASSDVGADAYERGDYAAAARELLGGDVANDPDAQALLGYLYDQGLGVPRNRPEAARWYLAAAKNGNPIAQLNIGIMYGEGDGIARDLVKAFRWFDRAAMTFPPGEDRNDAISKRELARNLMSPQQRRQVEGSDAPSETKPSSKEK